MKKIIISLLLIFSLTFAAESIFYDAEFIKLHDGDTATLRIQIGFDLSMETPVRLRGIDAPELKEGVPAIKAKDRLKELLSKGDLKIEIVKGNERDKYGRILGVIYTGKTNINETLLKEKLVKVYE